MYVIGFAGCMRGHNYKREGILGYPEKFYRKSTLEQFTVYSFCQTHLYSQCDDANV